MHASTIAALDEINQHFYSVGADNFDQTRSGPWEGWQRALELFVSSAPEPRGKDATPIRVLDVGCGNGRFATFLHENLPDRDIYYVGHDSSVELLNKATSRLAKLAIGFELHRTNLLGNPDDGFPDLLGEEDAYDLVVCFGVTHHIPEPLQEALLRRCLEATAKSGMTCVSYWQFGTDPRFARRRLPWTWAVDRGLLTLEQVGELDGDDWLLRWGSEVQDLARYCRHVSTGSVTGMFDRLCGSGASQLFFADGKSGELNLYGSILPHRKDA